MRSVRKLADDPDPERYLPGVLAWVHEAGNPYFDWILGGAERAGEVLAQWVRRNSSEVSIRRATLLFEDDRSVGGFIALDAAQLGRCRQADLLALMTKMASDKQFESRLKAAQHLFAKVEPGDFYLSKIGVEPEFRGRSLGKEILQAYADEGRDQGPQRLRLDVSAGNATAIRLYESFGFEVAGRTAAPEANLEYFAMVKAIA
jgi:ribosomal protein S18 acetylase RimI-like enzyme